MVDLPPEPPAIDELAIAYKKGFAFPRGAGVPPAGLYQDRAGWSWLVEPGGTIKRVGEGGEGALGTFGGRATIQTDSNGQATIPFPQNFPIAPTSIVVTVTNQILIVGILVLTVKDVTVFVWDVVGATNAANRSVDVFWIATFG